MGHDFLCTLHVNVFDGSDGDQRSLAFELTNTILGSLSNDNSDSIENAKKQ